LSSDKKIYDDDGLKGKLEYKEKMRLVTLREDLRLPDFALRRLSKKRYCVDGKEERKQALKQYMEI
jgi:hypothetical protein